MSRVQDSNLNMPEKSDGHRTEFSLRFYVFLDLDLLGQREAIAKLEDLTPLLDNESAYYDAFGAAVRSVWSVRKFLEARLTNGMAAAHASTAYPKLEPVFHMFSDTVIVYFPWNDNNPNAFVALDTLLVATAETMIFALANEVPVRGGIDVHIATDFSSQTRAENSSGAIRHGGDLWGPAPKRAYELAENNHNYMRIRVGEGVCAMANKLAEWIGQQVISDPWRAAELEPAREPAKRAVDLIAPDPVDELLIVDYLGRALADSLSVETRQLIVRAVAFGRREHERFRLDANPHGIVPALAGG